MYFIGKSSQHCLMPSFLRNHLSISSLYPPVSGLEKMLDTLILFSQKCMSFGGPQKGGKGLGVGIKPFWHHLLPFDSGQDLAFASLSSSVRMMPVPIIMGEDVCVAQHQRQ